MVVLEPDNWSGFQAGRLLAAKITAPRPVPATTISAISAALNSFRRLTALLFLLRVAI
jgi:hypothetical protein